MFKNLMILKAELDRKIILIKRYPFEPISNLIVICVGFTAICFGVNISNNNFNNINELFLRYLLGTLSMMLISDMGISIASEASLGTLERIYTMPSRLCNVITIRNIVSVLFVLMQLTMLVIYFVVLFDVNLISELNIRTLCAFVLYIISMVGVGYTLSGLTLAYKNIGSISQLLQFIFLFIALIPYDFIPGVLRYIIGLVPGAMAIQIMNNSYNAFDVIVAIIVSTIHLIIGIILFMKMEKKILINGSLGKY